METLEYVEFVGPSHTTVINTENIPVYWRTKGQDHTHLIRDRKRVDLVNVNFSDLAEYLKGEYPERYHLIESKSFDSIVFIDPTQVDLVFTIQHKGKILQSICGIVYRGRSYEVPLSINEVRNILAYDGEGERSDQSVEGDLGELFDSEDTAQQNGAKDPEGDTGNLNES